MARLQAASNAAMISEASIDADAPDHECFRAVIVSRTELTQRAMPWPRTSRTSRSPISSRAVN
jgi:hypothetical protein